MIIFTRKTRIYKEFKYSIENIFEKLLRFSFFSGKFAFDCATLSKSDIDVIVVLKNQAYSENISKKLSSFVREYMRINRKYGYRPDLQFPGDVISESQVTDCVNGRGFDIINGFSDYLPIKCEEDFERENMDYRIWRHELCFSNGAFVNGDYQSFRKACLGAIKTEIAFLTTKKDIPTGRQILEEILKRGREIYGINEDYKNFINSYNLNLFEEAIISFKDEKNNKKPRSGAVCCKSKYLYNWNDLRRIALDYDQERNKKAKYLIKSSKEETQRLTWTQAL